MTNPVADPLIPIAVPEPVPASEGMAPVKGAELFYWDTGGTGPAVVLVHPNAGSALSWAYQQPVFAKAGYRVIAYSRRNHYRSDMASKEDPGVASDDLEDMLDFLSVEKAHLVGAAAAGGIVTDFALSHPKRLLSLVLVSRTGGVREGPIAEAISALKPEQWPSLPRWFQEVGPSYRAANPEGVARWIEINRLSEIKGGGRQKSRNKITAERLAEITTPTLLITGTADLTAPPSMVRLTAASIPGSEVVVVGESGHSLYWEQPEVFNRALLEFFARHQP